MRGWMMFTRQHEAGLDVLRVQRLGYEGTEGLVRLLRFMGTLRDQVFLRQADSPV